MKPVTPELLRRYAAGTLSDAEQHRVERAALDDPFVADALDGFLAMEGKSVPLEELQARLDRRTRPNRRLIGWAPLATAAGLAGILFLGYSLFFRTQAPLTPEIAKQSAPPALKDSVVPAAPVPMAEQPAVAYAPPKARLSNRDEPAGSSQRTADSSIPQVAMAAAPIPARKMAMKLASPDTFRQYGDAVPPQAMLQGKVVADSGKGEVRTKLSTPADSTVPGLGADTSLMNEVVTVGYGRQAITERPPIPFRGIGDFRTYLSTRRRIPAQEPPIGKVILQFRVNTDSTLSRLRVVKGLGKPYDDEALRLVREGPRWLPALRNGKPVSRKTRVEIPF
ncbi:energy transducer TonB [Siphonobacter aquaeclarae]|uniref:TonB protein C-terminal n=1 Tax=Siphonobacter aquaeclarae TaxID=563176 RepID=A0A1G9V5F0_9BACT|nr:energy transducer TonB [Siphonobacter aquaeclarae]SDM67353.1 TonB protein C-terminal [Siphonobacter aquaeclarae]